MQFLQNLGTLENWASGKSNLCGAEPSENSSSQSHPLTRWYSLSITQEALEEGWSATWLRSTVSSHYSQLTNPMSRAVSIINERRSSIQTMHNRVKIAKGYRDTKVPKLVSQFSQPEATSIITPSLQGSTLLLICGGELSEDPFQQRPLRQLPQTKISSYFIPVVVVLV